MARSIQYELDKMRNLTLNMEAIETYEDMTGKLFMSTDLAKLSTKQMLTLCYASAKTEDNSLTYDDFKALIEKHSDFTQLYEKTLEVCMATIPEPEPKKAGGSKNAVKA